MPRYFFHLRGDGQNYEDAIGSVFDNLEGAEMAALRVASCMIEEAGDITELSHRYFEITDSRGACLCVVPLGTILLAEAS
jgi:hypothetical protein